MLALLLSFLTLITVTSCEKKSSKAPVLNHVVDIEFDDGLGKGERAFSLFTKSPHDQKRYRLLKKMWEQNRPSHVYASKDGKIPKIIHQIWIGPKRPPRFYYEFRKTWEQMHPDWEYRLWTNSEAENLDFELKEFYQQSTNWGEKADILRCEILQSFGGIYVDIDFECLQPFDELVSRYDFFAGMEPPHAIPESKHVLLISNALIATVPQHPIIKRWKELIKSRWKKAEKECFNPIEKVLLRTYLPFGEAVEAELEVEGYTNVIFPSTYFYPIKPLYLRHPPKQPSFFKNILIAFDIKNSHAFSQIKKESMAVHHFAGDWQKSHHELIKDIHKEIIKLKEKQTEMQTEINDLREKLAS